MQSLMSQLVSHRLQTNHVCFFFLPIMLLAIPEKATNYAHDYAHYAQVILKFGSLNKAKKFINFYESVSHKLYT